MTVLDPYGAFARRIDPLPAAGATGPLAGLRLAVKDNLDIAGLPTHGGGRAPLSVRAERTATVVRRLVAAGMVPVGKTLMSELAFGGWGSNAATGCPRNPWDRRIHRVPGGSSSGSAAAVAGDLADAALGTDTGGSVRIPASLCGLTGIRPARGRVSRAGLHALAPSLDVIGPLAWSIEIAAHMLGAMAGTDTDDPDTAAAKPFDAEAALGAPVARLRLATLVEPDLEAAAPAVRDAYGEAVRTLGSLVGGCAAVVLPRAFDDYVGRLGAILGHEAWHLHGARLDTHEAGMDPWVVKRLRAGAGVSEAAYRAALADRAAERQSFAAALAGFDALLTPATPIAAPRLDEVDERRLPLSHYVRAFSYLDLPAVALPCGATGDGLPIGLQIVGLRGDEGVPVALAAAYQRATAWHERRPPV
jgi:aspartyl-tRNA(Asn)/glutamyl-tRNA(Gln) amidotransferase subunit A